MICIEIVVVTVVTWKWLEADENTMNRELQRKQLPTPFAPSANQSLILQEYRTVQSAASGRCLLNGGRSPERAGYRLADPNGDDLGTDVCGGQSERQ